MHTKLLNLGFTPCGDTYVCEDIAVQIRGDMIYIIHLNAEVTIDEFERLLLDD